MTFISFIPVNSFLKVIFYFDYALPKSKTLERFC